ncbi:LysR family transcriptional regulator [Halotalea alkalilenta]|uniref:LysR family transcriptional regulator n=1 Tax=Halotalea alkalilenta TaxID=376489 RepID=UPI000694FD9A|nr:LysR family transcriptional regulator [Halotalea alkalilenta]
MELRHLRYFVAVARELHFSRAAKQLHIAQPALSIQIRALENMLGGPLFHRAHRGVTLTEAGRLFLVEAERVLAQVARAEDLGRRALKGEVAVLELGYSGGALFSGVLRRSIVAVKRNNPDIDLSLHDLDPRCQIDRLMAREIHVGLMTTLSLSIPNELRATQLEAWPVWVALPSQHDLAELPAVPVDALRNEMFYTYAAVEHQNISWIRSIIGTSPTRERRVSSVTMAMTLVGAGLGVSLLPASLPWPNPDGAVVFKPLKDRSVLMDCTLIQWRSEYEPGVRSALGSILDEFALDA